MNPLSVKKIVVLGIFVSLLASGPAYSGVKLQLAETGVSLPYLSLGFSEVKIKAPGKELKGDKAVKKAEKRARKLRAKLYKKLKHDAKQYFKADAVINIKYWPELDSAKFPHKYVYARGEMIRYNKFPSDSTEVKAPRLDKN